jgi:hypothetical protein
MIFYKKLNFWELTKSYLLLISLIKVFVWVGVLYESKYLYLTMFILMVCTGFILSIELKHQAKLDLYFFNLFFWGAPYLLFFPIMLSYKKGVDFVLNQSFLILFGAIILAIMHAIIDIIFNKKKGK